MAEFGDGESGCLAGGGVVGGVACVKGGAGAEGFDLIDEAAEAVFAAGGDDDVSAVLRERESGGTADAGAGSGDDGGFVGEGRGREDNHGFCSYAVLQGRQSGW